MNQLTKPESTRLNECEAVIQRGREEFVAVGTALGEIRESKLYRVDHATFEDYCEARWKLSRGRAYQLIAASEVVQCLPMVDIPNERVARELGRVPEQHREAVAKEAAKKGMTAASVAKARDAVIPPPPPALDTVTDAEGHQITDAKAAAAYLERHRFEEIGREIDRVRRMVKDLGELPIGVCLDTQRIMNDLHNAKGDILAARPHVQCPHRNCKETCRSCEGRRWITKQLWMATAEEFKQ